MKYSEEQYIETDPFEDDRDTNIRHQKIKIVKVRKEHLCAMGTIDQHEIRVGEMARREVAIIDDDGWGTCYCCIPCMDKWMSELGLVKEIECPECAGEGVTMVARCYGGIHREVFEECEHCDGDGFIEEEK